MRLADPRPGFCSVCYSAQPEYRYVDCEVAFDGAPVMDADTHTIAILPWNGELGGHDDLFICEACAKSMCELLDLKPELHTRQLHEIRRLEIERDHWKATAKSAQAELNRQLDVNLGVPDEPMRRGPGRPRKVLA